VKSGESLIVPMPVWFEFLCGPVTENQIETLRAFIFEIVPFGENQAVESARLFNIIQRKRQHRVDAMIAGTAIIANAGLATNNRTDFEVFTRHGLKIV
jgi:predicted nucleic acid-binding protein